MSCMLPHQNTMCDTKFYLLVVQNVNNRYPGDGKYDFWEALDCPRSSLWVVSCSIQVVPCTFVFIANCFDQALPNIIVNNIACPLATMTSSIDNQLGHVFFLEQHRRVACHFIKLRKKNQMRGKVNSTRTLVQG